LNLNCQKNNGGICSKENPIECPYLSSETGHFLSIRAVINCLRLLEQIPLRRLKFKTDFLKSGDEDSKVIGQFLDGIMDIISEEGYTHPQVSGLKGNPFLVEYMQNQIKTIQDTLVLLIQDKMEVVEPVVIERALTESRDLKSILARLDLISFL